MAISKGYTNVEYRWQGISLHCWRNVLEMLMEWRYGCIYGVDGREDRTEHTDQVKAASHYGHDGASWSTANSREMANRELGKASRTYGYSLESVRDYGLRQAVLRSETIGGLVECLKAGGPIAASGTFGPARFFPGGHVVLVIGVSGSNKVVYYDPFLIGMKAITSNHKTYVSEADFFKRVHKTFGVPSLIQAEAFTETPAAKGWIERT